LDPIKNDARPGHIRAAAAYNAGGSAKVGRVIRVLSGTLQRVDKHAESYLEKIFILAYIN
jgi:hypothetical protein